MSGGKVSGKVKWFNNAKGYGFIIEDGKTEDLFAHYSAIQMEGYKTLKAGQAVVFDIIQGPKGLHAINIGNSVDASKATTPPCNRPLRHKPPPPSRKKTA
ncbi:cold shock domain protein CspD [Pseudomonas fluorescens]|uniref:Cold shock-like protein CspD n=2 Tax=Pseudomonas fluorescens TaxID=294 RepID=A0A327MP26_PSEFL|nr:cold shock domain-containing protein CspD [Pseudomonas fluorescens]RAI64627.1 cold shock domain protein CspD [Pseudomonas fluorescens]